MDAGHTQHTHAHSTQEAQDKRERSADLFKFNLFIHLVVPINFIKVYSFHKHTHTTLIDIESAQNFAHTHFQNDWKPSALTSAFVSTHFLRVHNLGLPSSFWAKGENEP